MPEPRTLAEIGAAYRQRRLALGLNQHQLEGVSSATLHKIEKGIAPEPRDRTKVNLANALRWEDDAYEVLRNGGTPAERPQTITGRGHGVLGGLVGAAAADTTDINSRVARLSPEDQRTIKELIDRFERDMD